MYPCKAERPRAFARGLFVGGTFYPGIHSAAMLDAYATSDAWLVTTACGKDTFRKGGAMEFAFLAGGGEAGERMRSLDWTTSPLDFPSAWPEALKVLVSVMLASTQPMFLVWGPDRIFLYNDSFTPIAGASTWSASGSPAISCGRKPGPK